MTIAQAWWVLYWFNIVVLIYFVMLNNIYLITSIFSFVAMRRYTRRIKVLDFEEFLTSTDAPGITLIAPAYNEESTCVSSVKSLLALKYPKYEILFINDGSHDATLARLTEAYKLVPAVRPATANIPTALIRNVYQSRLHRNLWVFDKENGGKADSLNVGLNYCSSPLFCAMDADCLLEHDALNRIIRPFMEDADTIAVGGVIRIANDSVVKDGIVTEVRLPRKLMVRFQVLEYLRAFLSGRLGWDVVGATLVISGAFGLFKRSLVVQAGGYATTTIGEDMELVVRLHRHCREKKIPYKIGFVPDPIAWTEAPDTLRVLARQRDRWQRGLMDSLSRHRIMLFNPRYGKIGLLAFPYFYIFEMLGPVIEFGGYLIFFLVIVLATPPPLYMVSFLTVAIIYGIALSVAAIALEELSFRRYTRTGDLVRFFLLAVLENFGYRQLLNLWRIRGILSSLRRVKTWGKMERKGFEGVLARERAQVRAAKQRRA